MSITNKFSFQTLRTVGIVLFAASLALAIGIFGASQPEQPFLGLAIIFACAIAITIVRYPYWGIIATIATLPILEILPPIPFANSAVALIGGVTLGAFVLERVLFKKPFGKLSAIHFAALVLIGWMLVTNPDAALLDDDRNWFFTYIQLWLLIWLTGKLLTTPQRQRALMWTFAGLCVLSALFAITEGTIGPTWRTSARAAGLAGGDNGAARYFLVGFIFLTYLSTQTNRQWWLRLLTVIGSAIVLVGVAFTLSRTGFILAVTAIGLLLIQRTSRRQRIGTVILLLVLVVGGIALPDTYWQIIFSSMSDIQTGGGTIGLRYGLWQAGFKMWLDHPLMGVGIGQFDNYLPQYGAGLVPTYHYNLGAHNLYISMLAETGLVGLLLFGGLIATVLRALFRAVRSLDTEKRALAQVWLMVLIVILVGGLTKHDQYDKLLWLIFGIGAALSSSEFMQTENAVIPRDESVPLPLSQEVETASSA
ncbi:O-antigen ligase family protein [Anaerolineae bacterium CFX7]|nr:O-antigen ligase family protein [Anaerolineae bacterium CFX7]